MHQKTHMQGPFSLRITSLDVATASQRYAILGHLTSVARPIKALLIKTVLSQAQQSHYVESWSTLLGSMRRMGKAQITSSWLNDGNEKTGATQRRVHFSQHIYNEGSRTGPIDAMASVEISSSRLEARSAFRKNAQGGLLRFNALKKSSLVTVQGMK
jgi:hypothetical protein